MYLSNAKISFGRISQIMNEIEINDAHIKYTKENLSEYAIQAENI